jgi:hypothetical protein
VNGDNRRRALRETHHPGISDGRFCCFLSQIAPNYFCGHERKETLLSVGVGLFESPEMLAFDKCTDPKGPRGRKTVSWFEL